MHLRNVTPEQHEALKAIAEAVRSEIAPRVIGLTKPAWRCCCGALSSGEATAVAIRTPFYADQIAGWCVWTVDMAEASKKPGDYSYSVGLSDFLTKDELEEVFSKHFRPFVAEHFAEQMAANEARRAPGGDLRGLRIGLWF